MSYFTLVQETSSFAISFSAGVSQDFPSNNVSGNLLVAFVLSKSSSTPSIHDTQGNIWVLGATSPVVESTYSSVFYCLSSTAGANTVSVTNGGIATGLGLIEYSS